MACFPNFNISLLLVLSYFCSEMTGQNHRGSLSHLRRDRGGSGFTAYHIALVGSWSCDSTVVAFLDQQLALTHSLALAASTALFVPGSEKSASYHRWFGDTNENMKEVIKRNNYDAVVDYLLSPSSIIDWYSTHLNSADGPFTNFAIDPTSLVYVCGRSNEAPCDNEDCFAATLNQTPSRPNLFGATVLALCPTIFTLSSFEQMKATWILSAGKDYLDDAASTLLHEAQHMSYITGPSNRRIDVDSGGLKYPERACYNPQMCSELFEDSEKLQNADNYVFFAMDALFRPDTVAAPAPAGHQRAAKPRDRLVASSPILLEIGLSSFITSSLKSATATSNSTSSSTRSSSSSTSSSSTSALSSRTTTSSTTSSQRVLSPIPITTTVDHGHTINVGAGIIVVGGTEGGYYVEEGQTFYVGDGQSETAGDSANESITPSRSSTTTSQSPSYFDIDLYTLDNSQISSVMGILGYITVTQTTVIVVTSSSTTIRTSTITESSTRYPIATRTTPPESIPSGTYAFDLCLFNRTQTAPPGEVWPYGLYVHPTSDDAGTWFVYVPWVICNDSAYYTVNLKHSDNTVETIYLGGPAVDGSIGEADSANTSSPVTSYWWQATNSTT